MQRQVGKRLTALRIGEHLAELRRHRGMTQDQLAERLQVERETVSRFERGVTDPSISKVLEICDILEVPVATLITRASVNVSDYRVRIEEALHACLPEDRELLCDTLERLADRLADRLGKQTASEPSGVPGREHQLGSHSHLPSSNP